MTYYFKISLFFVIFVNLVRADGSVPLATALVKLTSRADVVIPVVETGNHVKSKEKKRPTDGQRAAGRARGCLSMSFDH